MLHRNVQLTGRKMRKLSALPQLSELFMFVVSVWLFLAPFVLGFFTDPIASAVTLTMATVVFLLTQSALARKFLWEESGLLIIAAYIITTPWLFRFDSIITATINSVFVGIVIVLFALTSSGSTRHDHHIV